MVYHKILNMFPCANQQDLVVLSRNEILIHATTQMNLEDIMVSEISQS